MKRSRRPGEAPSGTHSSASLRKAFGAMSHSMFQAAMRSVPAAGASMTASATGAGAGAGSGAACGWAASPQPAANIRMAAGSRA